MKIILLVLLTVNLAFAQFSRNGNIVSDSVSSLQWQDNATPSSKTWQDAIDYCERLSLDEHSDWRLPNINELLSMVDNTKYNPAIRDIFVNFTSDYYWSSTTNAGGTSYAWRVHFSSGFSRYGTKTNEYYVRCVRAGQ